MDNHKRHSVMLMLLSSSNVILFFTFFQALEMLHAGPKEKGPSRIEGCQVVTEPQFFD